MMLNEGVNEGVNEFNETLGSVYNCIKWDSFFVSDIASAEHKRILEL